MKLIICIITFIHLSLFQATKNEITYDKEIVSYVMSIWKSDNLSNKVNENFSKFEKTENFFKELKKEKSELLDNSFLSSPNNNTLIANYLYTKLKWNSSEPEFLILSDKKVIKNALKKIPSRYELLVFYYNTIYIEIFNEHRPINLSMINIELENLNLNNDTEKNIVFLSAMKFLGKQITRYSNKEFPVNCKKAKKYVTNMPKFNGKMFYEYEINEMEDFEMEIDKRFPKSSFKEKYIQIYQTVKNSYDKCVSVRD